MNVLRLTSHALLAALVVSGCTQPQQASTPTPSPASPAPTAPHGAIDRNTFNRAAVRLNLPVYWTVDRNNNNQIDPDEVTALRFYGASFGWTHDGAFTPAFHQAYADIQRWAAAPPLPSSLAAEELQRRALVIEDLDQGAPTLVHSDFRNAPPTDRKLVATMLELTDVLDQLYAQQSGLPELMAKLPADDPASASLFRRNWGPRCVGPRTQNNPLCSAIPGVERLTYGIYPASLQADKDFCSTLEKHPKSKELLDPFVVVREQEGQLIPMAVTEAYKPLATQAASTLRRAAHELDDPAEQALKAYLMASAKSFEDNDWEPADEAWANMTAQNSRWYLRVGPDEVYWDPCNQKAGFHLTFARINTASLEWQQKLKPVQQEMEDVLARLIGAPYLARKVTFHLPDFIDIVINAGDDRDPMGATIGQSLPNWGPVANEGRGRTVAMSNLYTDPDSMRVRREQAESLMMPRAMKAFVASETPGLLGTILHEAMHNLGPSHDYQVGGKTSRESFGGPLSSTLEELKAQTGALWFIEFLRAKKLISDELAQQSYLDSFVWSLGHISRGMYDEAQKPKPYSQLSAIQIGFLIDKGVVTFDPEAGAANGTDRGAFNIAFDRLAPAIEELMKSVGAIKAKGDKAAAEQLIKRYVDGNVVPQKLIAERILRHPKASFVYAIEL